MMDRIKIVWFQAMMFVLLAAGITAASFPIQSAPTYPSWHRDATTAESLMHDMNKSKLPVYNSREP